MDGRKRSLNKVWKYGICIISSPVSSMKRKKNFEADVIACSPSPVPPSLGMRKEVVSRQEAFTMIPSQKKIKL